MVKTKLFLDQDIRALDGLDESNQSNLSRVTLRISFVRQYDNTFFFNFFGLI